MDCRSGLLHFFQNAFSLPDPDGCLWVCVVMVKVVLDRLFQLLHAAEDSVAYVVADNVAEPAFNRIQP